MGGKSLIRSAKLREVMSMFMQYKTAINTFKLQYDAFPGDFREAKSYWIGCTDVFGVNDCNGDGNGIIAGTESNRAWEHLMWAELIAGNYDGSTNIETIPGVNVGKGAFSGTFYGMGAVPIYSANWGNRLSFRPLTGGKSISAKEAKMIDKQMDDGSPDTGKMKVFILGVTGCVDGGIFSASVNFILDSTEETCSLGWDLE